MDLDDDTREQIEELLFLIEEHKPWLEAPDVWKTESQYWTWVRGQVRGVWSDFPPRRKLKWKLREMRGVIDEDGNPVIIKSGPNIGCVKTRWEIKCVMCEVYHKQSMVEMDHIHPAGGCKDGLELCSFLFRLLCPMENIRPVCTPCHKIHTYAEKMNLTFEEARKAKEVIILLKQSGSVQKKQLKGFGYSDDQITNAKLRKVCYTELTKEGKL